MTPLEKIAYLKGLSDGLLNDKSSAEYRLFAAVIDVLEDLAADVDDIEETVDELSEEIDDLSFDVSALEELVYDEQDDDDDMDVIRFDDICGDDDDDDDDCDCGDDDCLCCAQSALYEVKCPACENEITIDEDILELGSITCPNCGETLEFDTVEDEE